MAFDEVLRITLESLSGQEGGLAPALALPIIPMRFVFTKLFYLLIAAGLILLSLSWGRPMVRWAALAYDVVLIALAIFDARRSQLPKGVLITREFSGRFAVGAETTVSVNIRNALPHAISLIVKDEFPPQMKLSGL